MADRDMRRYELFEVKVATFLIGLCSMVTGATTYGPTDSLFVQALQATPIAHSWGLMLLAVGAYTIAASMGAGRARRHHALTLSWVALWATFGIFLHWGRLTLPALLVWIHGTAALVTMIVDVHLHARAMERVRGTRRGPAIG